MSLRCSPEKYVEEYQGFSSNHLPQYELGLIRINFTDQTGCGVFLIVWSYSIIYSREKQNRGQLQQKPGKSTTEVPVSCRLLSAYSCRLLVFVTAHQNSESPRQQD